MSGTREVRNRIRSVKNIGQITRALEAVSASRVRRAQARVLASRAYAEKAMEILQNVQSATAGATALHPLLEDREEVNTIMMVLITSDRGLAGAFNTNIIRVAERFAQRLEKPVQWVAVGRKGRDALIRAGRNVVAEFSDIPDDLTIADIAPVARLAKDAYMSGEVDDVYIAYTDFINTLTQRPAVIGWLPLVPRDLTDENFKKTVEPTASNQDYEFEPNAQSIIDEIVPRFTELTLYQAFLESKASEHSARMVAMRNASDNAGQLVDDLTLVYNKARQASITAEILDIVGGAKALQDSLDRAADEIMHTNYQEDYGIGYERAEDDLKRIEGIGPKMESALKAAGIRTYRRLAGASEAELQSAIQEAGLRLAPGLSTWAQQAALAARGDWAGLEAYQSQLVAGRET